MAKIILEVDTSKKTGKVTVDGKKVDDVQHVIYYSPTSFMEFGIEITSRKEGEDLQTITRLVADQDGNMVDNPDKVGGLDISRALATSWNVYNTLL